MKNTLELQPEISREAGKPVTANILVREFKSDHENDKLGGTADSNSIRPKI